MDSAKDERLPRFEPAARRGAARVSNDDQVVGEAVGHALLQLNELWDRIADDDRARRKWVDVVAANYARRLGAKLHKELPFGQQGSEPPVVAPQGEGDIDDAMNAEEHIGRLIAEMRTENQPSLGSLVAFKVDFEDRWNLMSRDDQELLHAKHVEGLTSKEIAAERGLGETAGAIDHRLTAARKNARLLFEDLLDELRGGRAP